MKTLDQLEDDMNKARDLYLEFNKLACDIESSAEKIRSIVSVFEEEYDKAKRDVDMYDEDQIALAESKKDLKEDMALEDKLQG